MSESNVGDRFDRLPATESERSVAGRATREAVVAFFATRYGIPRATLTEYTFWEKGNGKIWGFAADHPSPVTVEALGIHLLRTRQRFWKPTTDGVQVLGPAATTNVLVLSEGQALRFWRGETQPVNWDGAAGYLIVARKDAGRRVPLGVGRYLDGSLESLVPKARQENLDPTG